MGSQVVTTYVIEGQQIDVVGCWDKETPEGTFDFYDLYDDAGTSLNLGDPWYPGEYDATDTTPPSEESVRTVLAGYANFDPTNGPVAMATIDNRVINVRPGDVLSFSNTVERKPRGSCTCVTIKEMGAVWLWGTEQEIRSALGLR